MCAVQPAVRNVGVVEPRVVVKIPWAKLKPSSNSKKSSGEISDEEQNSELSKIELCSRSQQSLDPSSESGVVAAARDGEMAKRMKNRDEEKFHLEPFSFTEKLPEHFREALRARKRSLQDEEHFSCCERKRKKKKKGRRRRKDDPDGNISEDEISSCREGADGPAYSTDSRTATAYCCDHVVNPLKLVRSSSEEFKIESKKKFSTDLKQESVVAPKISPIDSSSNNFLSANNAATVSSTELDCETGFSRYRDTCLDFGDLVRQSKLQLSEKDKSKARKEACLEKSSGSKKHRHSKCKKHRHRVRSKHRCKSYERLNHEVVQPNSAEIESVKFLDENDEKTKGGEAKVDQNQNHSGSIEESDELEIHPKSPIDLLSMPCDLDLQLNEVSGLSHETSSNLEVSKSKLEREKTEKDKSEKMVLEGDERSKDTQVEEKERKKIASVKFLVEKETDGKWLYCKVEGCHFWTRKHVRMTRHNKSHARTEDNRLIYQCPDCKLKISSLPKLLRHDRKFHTGFKDYECKICEAEVTDIAVHMRVSSMWP